MVADKEVPAPVAPVTAFICISLFSKPFAAKGKIANCKAVAKHPGFAMYFAVFITVLSNSGKPYTKSFPSKFLSVNNLKSLLKSMIFVFLEKLFFSKNVVEFPCPKHKNKVSTLVLI